MDLSMARCRRRRRTGHTPAENLLADQSLPLLDHALLPDAELPQPGDHSRGEPPTADQRMAAMITAAIVDVIAGRRAAHQLEDWVSPELGRLAQALGRSRSSTGLRIRSLRIQCPRPEAIEVCARLSTGTHSLAAALRLIRTPAGWRAVHLSIALRPGEVTQVGRPC